MDKLHKYILALVKDRFYGSVKIVFENGLPVTMKEEKSIDTAPFKEEIKENLKKGYFGKNN
ncbi:MAG: hypothetical protein ABIC68_04465 [Candidatus Omnitrophota bacterium]